MGYRKSPFCGRSVGKGVKCDVRTWIKGFTEMMREVIPSWDEGDIKYCREINVREVVRRVEEEMRQELDDHCAVGLSPRMGLWVPDDACMMNKFMRKFSTYKMWMNNKMIKGNGWKSMSLSIARDLMKLRLSCDNLAVNDFNLIRQGVRFRDRKCPLCSSGRPQDLVHVLFECPCTSAEISDLNIGVSVFDHTWWDEIYRLKLVETVVMWSRRHGFV